MAQLKDLIVSGASRLIGDTFATSLQTNILKAPITAGGTTYGLGTSGYVLKTNGSSIYWGADNNTTYTLAGLMGNTAKGSETQPVYWNGSAWTNTTYTLGASVPNNAKFTDTTYSAGSGLSLSGTTFNHSNSITAGTIADGGATRTLAFGGTFKIPSVTYDAQGHITSTTSITLTMPANPNSDTKVTNTLGTTTKFYVTGTTSTATNTGTQYFDTGVYVSATAGELVATTFTGALNGNAATATTATNLSANPTVAWTGGTTAGPTLKVTAGGKTSTAVAIPSASASASGAITTGAQTLAGNKTFSGNTTLNGTTTFGNNLFLSGTSYGQELPTTGTEGQVFFQLSDEYREIPSGGTVGQMLVKTDNSDYVYDWQTVVALPTGGTTEQVLSKIDDIDGNAQWVTLNYIPLAGGTLSSNGAQIKRPGAGVSWINGRDNALISTTSYSGYNSIYSLKTTNGDWSCGVYTNDVLYWTYCTDANHATNTNTTTTQMSLSSAGRLTAASVAGAIWNDYAEYRQADSVEPGRCVIENGNDTLSLSTARMQPGAEIISDTFGFAIGETDECKTPIAATGRVLAYPYEDREEYRKAIGRPVCSGPNGTVSIMTDEEYTTKGYCCIGFISAVPDYEKWGTGKAKVNGRVWIRVR